MNAVVRTALVAVALSFPAVTRAQEVAPFFEQVPSVLVDTYADVNAPVFTEYFEMLVDRDVDSEGTGWSIYTRSPTDAIRVTVLPEGLDSMLGVLNARGTGFQDFDDGQVELWLTAWGTRQVSVYNSSPAMSAVPEGFSVEDIRELPFTRVIVYELEWDQAPAFRAALRERSALDRGSEIGDNFVMTAWNGGIGTAAQTVVLRISAESRAADAGPNQQGRRAARADYREEWNRLSGVMNASARTVTVHNETFRPSLSFTPGN